jgi:hypothetical protein
MKYGDNTVQKLHDKINVEILSESLASHLASRLKKGNIEKQ